MPDLCPDDMVAILPTKEAPPSDVLQIATVQYVGHAIILLIDGRMYSNSPRTKYETAVGRLCRAGNRRASGRSGKENASPWCNRSCN